jgi:hypothetical protein
MRMCVVGHYFFNEIISYVLLNVVNVLVDSESPAHKVIHEVTLEMWW